MTTMAMEPAGDLRRRMIEEMQLRRYSERTQESYVRAVGQLAGWCWKSPGAVGDEEIRVWLERRQEQYEADKTKDMHEVEVLGALARKYPNAPWE